MGKKKTWYEKQKKTFFLREIVIVLLLFLAFMGYSAYKTAEGFGNDGIKMEEDPVVNDEKNTILFWVELDNKGYVPLDLKLTLEFRDTDHNKSLGKVEESISIDGKGSARKSFIVTVDEESINHTKSTAGLKLRITPTVSATYLGIVPIPEAEIAPVEMVVFYQE